MAVVEPLWSYDAEANPDGSRVEVVRLVDRLGPISPELALVDPQLATYFRALLPDVRIARPPQTHERALSPPILSTPARSKRAIPWRLAGVCAVVAAAASAAFGVWTTVAGSDSDLSAPPSAETESTFFTTPPIEANLSPDEIASLETAVRSEPRSPLAREALGTAYFRLGRWADAEREFKALVELSPSDKFAHYALGRTLTSQGRQREAGLELDLAGSLSKDQKSFADGPAG